MNETYQVYGISRHSRDTHAEVGSVGLLIRFLRIREASLFGPVQGSFGLNILVFSMWGRSGKGSNRGLLAFLEATQEEGS